MDRSKWCFAVASVLACVGVVAAPVLVVSDTGTLLGADAVAVNGLLYDVRFKDGTVGSLGLLEPENPFFEASTAAEAAAAALRNVANVGDFGRYPQRINGCGHAEVCSIVTVAFGFTLWHQGNPLPAFRGFEMANWTSEGLDWRDGDVNPWANVTTYDSATQDGGGNVFAVWSMAAVNPVSEPPSSPLALLSLVAIALAKRRRRA